jgi:hypothetical protein
MRRAMGPACPFGSLPIYNGWHPCWGLPATAEGRHASVACTPQAVRYWWENIAVCADMSTRGEAFVRWNKNILLGEHRRLIYGQAAWALHAVVTNLIFVS